MKLKVITTLAVIAVCFCVVSQGQAEMLTNAGFEDGDLTGWSPFGNGWRVSTGGDAHSGTYGAVNDVWDWVPAGFHGIVQEVAITGGEEYNASVYLRTVNLSADTTEAWLELQFLDATNGVLEQHESVHVSGNQDFTLMSLGDLVAPAAAVKASIKGIIQVKATPADTKFHIFDDFSFYAVPEPTTCALIAMGGMALLRRRKK